MPVGIDVSKLKFNVHFLDKNIDAEFENNNKGFKKFYSWLKKHKALNSKICMESTGVYSYHLANFLFEKSICVYVVNPFCIKSFAGSKLKRIKTDEVDAQLIAEFCLEREKELQAWKPLPENHLELKELKKRLAKKFDKDQALKEKKELLETIDGIGEDTARLILLETGDMENFESARDLAAYTGITPSIRQSGSSLKSNGSISRKGNKHLRSELYMPALSAIKHNPIIKKFAERLKAKGKAWKEIICAVIRKLLHIAFGVLKNRIPFNPNYVNMQFA